MGVREAKEKLNITPEEEKSLQDYTGFWHMTVNTLTNITPNTYEKLKKSGWFMIENKKEIQKALRDFINIYSAMYKNSKNKNFSGTLIRGTGKEDINRIKEKTEQFLSTTTSEDIAKTFSHYGDDALVRISLDENVPYIDMDKYHVEGTRNESEILIAPFCKVSSKLQSSSRGSYTYYNMKLEKDELQEVDKDELSVLEEDIINGFSENKSNIEKYISLESEIEYFTFKISQMTGNANEQARLYEQKEKKFEEFSKISNKIHTFKDTIRKYLEGACKQKELEIDKEYEIVKNDEIKQKEEEKRKVEFDIREGTIQNIKNSMNEITIGSTSINLKLSDFYKDLFLQNKNFNKIRQTLLLNEKPNENIEKIGQLVNNIKIMTENSNKTVENENETINEETIQKLNQKSIKTERYSNAIKAGNAIVSDLYKIYDEFETESNINIKEEVLKKSLQIVKDAKLNQYAEQYQHLAKQKIGFFGKLFGKEKLKQEQMRNLELKMEKEKTKISPQAESTNNFSIRNTLAELYLAANYDVDVEHNSEILNYYNTIRSVFGQNRKAFSEELIAKIAQEKIDGNVDRLPVPENYKESTRNKIARLKIENEKLQNENLESDNQKQNDFKESQKVEEDKITLILKKVKNIERVIENNPYYERDERENRDNSLDITAELFL